MQNLKQLIKRIAFDLGFHAVGITSANDIPTSEKHFLEWRDLGYAADMNYLLREDPINAKPTKILSEGRSIITLLVNYYTKPPENPGRDFGRVAAYAVGLDYHTILKSKINLFQAKLRKEFGDHFISKGFSDSVPLLEKSFSRNAGLGFMGKNTLIINKPFGSYFFICEIISNLDIESDAEKEGTCGKCTRCIDICPTEALTVGAIPAEGEARQGRHESPLLDSRLCISYLTIENRGSIENDLRGKIGNWIFGCDLCQEICPYNKKIVETDWEEFKPQSGMGHYLRLKDILSIESDKEFKSKFGNTAIMRTKRKGLIRNACIVAGNNHSEECLPELINLSKNENDPIIKEHALWALERFNVLKV
jgi:epoxyqueuosine reductase